MSLCHSLAIHVDVLFRGYLDISELHVPIWNWGFAFCCVQNQTIAVCSLKTTQGDRSGA